LAARLKPRPPQKQPSFRSAWTGRRPVPTHNH